MGNGGGKIDCYVRGHAKCAERVLKNHCRSVEVRLDASVHVYLFLSLSLFFFRSAFFLCFYLGTYDTGVAESRRGAATDTKRFRVTAERARTHTHTHIHS